MSDQHKHIALTPAAQIALLNKALAREKMARRMLEDKISGLNESRFNNNQALLNSYESAKIRQNQLEFLSFLNRDNTEHKKIDELIQFFASNVLRQLDQDIAIVYQYQNEQLENVTYTQKQYAEWHSLTPNKAIIEKLINYAPRQVSRWVKLDIKRDDLGCLPFLSEPILLGLKIPQNQNSHIVIFINAAHYCYSDELKHTIEIAANQFIDMIQKRTADDMLAKNYFELKEALALLQKTQQQLTHNEKMVSLGQLAAGVAHEINNPLSYLASNLETLQEYVDQIEQSITTQKNHDSRHLDKDEFNYLIEDSKAILHACLNGVKRVSDIVLNLKQFSRKGDHDFKETNLVDVIADSLAVVSNKVKHDCNVVVTHACADLIVLGNFGQLQQVFVNLFINAFDAMKERGTMNINSTLSQNQIVIMVKDNGTGIDVETINRVFEPFYTTKMDENGTGLGLSVSYAIITKHNATIQIDSKVNQGTIITLCFPAL